MREGFKVDEPLEICVEQKRDADSDQHGAEEERKTHAEKKADGVFTFRWRNRSRKATDQLALTAKRGAEDVKVSRRPKSNFVARLPQQIESCADDQRSDDTEEFGHGYCPRPAVREKN